MTKIFTFSRRLLYIQDGYNTATWLGNFSFRAYCILQIRENSIYNRRKMQFRFTTASNDSTVLHTTNNTANAKKMQLYVSSNKPELLYEFHLVFRDRNFPISFPGTPENTHANIVAEK